MKSYQLVLASAVVALISSTSYTHDWGGDTGIESYLVEMHTTDND